jgi:signal transduction histidine kinase
MLLNREPVDVRQLLSRVVASAQATAPHHRLVVHDRINGLAVVIGDRLRLEIVVNNLLDNAIKYSPGGGEVYCDLTATGGMLLLGVRDTGIGIAAEDMPRLFVRFSRLAAERLPDVPGTGLGLYLARELARLHGGDIVAVSGLGEGSEFTLSLPLDDTAAA